MIWSYLRAWNARVTHIVSSWTLIIRLQGWKISGEKDTDFPFLLENSKPDFESCPYLSARFVIAGWLHDEHPQTAVHLSDQRPSNLNFALFYGSLQSFKSCFCTETYRVLDELISNMATISLSDEDQISTLVAVHINVSDGTQSWPTMLLALSNCDSQ